MEGVSIAAGLAAVVLAVIAAVKRLGGKSHRKWVGASALAAVVAMILKGITVGPITAVATLTLISTGAGLGMTLPVIVQQIRKRPVDPLLAGLTLLLWVGGIYAFSLIEDAQAVEQARKHLAGGRWSAAVQALKVVDQDSRSYPAAHGLIREARTRELLEQAETAGARLRQSDFSPWQQWVESTASDPLDRSDRPAIAAALALTAEQEQEAGRHLVALQIYWGIEQIGGNPAVPEDLPAMASTEARSHVAGLETGDPETALGVIRWYRQVFSASDGMVAWLNEVEASLLAHEVAEVEELLANGQIDAAKQRLASLSARFPHQKQFLDHLEEVQREERNVLQEVEALKEEARFDRAIDLVRSTPHLDEGRKEKLESNLEQEKEAFLAAEKTRREKARALAPLIARAILEKSLKAPSTAQWVEEEVLDQDDYDRFLVRVVVDAQNSFGAFVRGRYAVVFRITDAENGDYVYHPRFAAQEIGPRLPDPTTQTAIGFLQGLNGWGEPPGVANE